MVDARVAELQPWGGDYFILIEMAIVLIWMKLIGKWEHDTLKNPIFILIAVCWITGLATRRIWFDIGAPVTAFWIAIETERCIGRLPFFSSAWRRALLVMAAFFILYSTMTLDTDFRWRLNRPVEFLSLDNPEHTKLLPEPGGIIYSNDMSIFYETFYKNPNAPWKYILGFEVGMMPKEDLDIMRNIQKNLSRPDAFQPWVKKMRRQDRLIVKCAPGDPPAIEGLEWHYATYGTWIGKLPDNTGKTNYKPNNTN